jgi:hypothetical protein
VIADRDEFSREALRARIGNKAFEKAERLAAEAPPPSPRVIEAIRLIFAPHVKRLAELEAQAPRAERAA